MILVVSSIALSEPRWQSSDSLATSINSDREGGGGLFANGESAGTSLSSGWSTCRTAPSAPLSMRTNLYLHSSDRASRNASATAASDCFARTFPGASARNPTRACSVKRERRLVKPMAHMVLVPSRPTLRRASTGVYCASMASGLPPLSHGRKPGPTRRKDCETRLALIGFTGREWAAYRAAPPFCIRFGSQC